MCKYIYMCVCLYRWFIWLLSIYFITYRCECACVQVYFEVGMNVRSFSICWCVTVGWIIGRWVDIKQWNGPQTAARDDKSLWGTRTTRLGFIMEAAPVRSPDNSSAFTLQPGAGVGKKKQIAGRVCFSSASVEDRNRAGGYSLALPGGESAAIFTEKYSDTDTETKECCAPWVKYSI